MEKKIEVLPGKSYPLGATVYEEGVNFCVFSKNCEEVELLLFDKDRPFGKVKRVIFNYSRFPSEVFQILMHTKVKV